MAEDRSELLKSLHIDRDERGGSGGGGGAGAWPVIAIIALLAAAGAVAFAFLRPPEVIERETVVERTVPADANGEDGGTTTTTTTTTRPTRSRGDLVASGYVVARRAATVSADITGRLIEVNFDEGAVVEEGQLLARLDSDLAEIDLGLARARAEVSRANADAIEADLMEARAALTRTQTLVVRGNASEAQLDIDRARVASLEARLAGARAEARSAELSADRSAELLERTFVRAPFAGVVIAKNAQAGEILSPASAGGGFTRTGVATLVDMASLEVEVDVNEAQIQFVNAGQSATITLDAYGDDPFAGEVIAIIPTANRDRATIQVRVGFTAPDARILPEMGATVTFDRSGR